MGKKVRLINANARIEEIKKAYCTNCDNYNGVRCRACWVDDAIGLIDDAPTAEAVEVARIEDARREILQRIDVLVAEYQRISEGYGGYYGAKADAMETARCLVNAALTDLCSHGEKRNDNGQSA